jgi:hypothetical protein
MAAVLLIHCSGLHFISLWSLASFRGLINAMDSDELPESPYDLGVLFVHGMGQSAQGETLVRFGEALRASVEDHLKPADDASKVEVRAARLSGSDGDQPARAELDIRGSQAARTPGIPVDSRWLLAEAWWTEKFPTPTYAEIVTWSFTALPATLVAHFDRRFRRIQFASERSLLSSRWTWNYLRALALLLWQAPVLLLALALTPIMLAATALLLLLGLAPKMRDLAGALQRGLAATIGDSYVFIGRPIIAAAICTSVRESLEWLAARCRKVAVVAHSQGGAIAHRVLRGPLTVPCDLLITFGSGLAKLSELERGVERGRVKLWVALSPRRASLCWVGQATAPRVCSLAA